MVGLAEPLVMVWEGRVEKGSTVEGVAAAARSFSVTVRLAVLFFNNTLLASLAATSASPVLFAIFSKTSLRPCAFSRFSSSSSFRAASRLAFAASFCVERSADTEADSTPSRAALREIAAAFWAAWDARRASVCETSTL